MHPADPYPELAKQLGREGFRARFPHRFLVNRPTGSPQGPDSTKRPQIEYATQSMSSKDMVEAGAFASEWWLAEITKRPGNPFPDRISLGRARNCDIVLRVSFVSKLHAHFFDQPGGGMTLCDQHSANGTWHRGQRLPPGESVAIEVGDWLRFGLVDVEVMDAARVYALMTLLAT